MNRVALRILVLRFEQNFFSLCVTTVSHVHICFGHRINLIGIDGAGTRLAEIGLRRRVRRIHTLPASVAEH